MSPFGPFDPSSPGSSGIPSAVTDWGMDVSASRGLTFAYLGGRAWTADGVLVQIAGGSLVLTANATNYIEHTTAGVVSTNTAGFTAGRMPMAVVVTNSQVMTSITDWRLGDAAWNLNTQRFPSYPELDYEIDVDDITYPYGNVKRFGATGDGVTDDTVALQNALDTAEAVSGVVFAPAGNYIYSAQITVPRGVKLKGEGMGLSVAKPATRFIASNAFPVGTSHFFMGESASLAFDTRIEDCRIFCNDIAGSIGIEAPTLNENSGLIRVLVQAYMVAGIKMYDQNTTTLFCSNFIIEDCQFWCGAAAAGSIGMDLSTCQRTGVIRKVSIVPNGAPADQLAGIRIIGFGGGDGGGPRIYDLHVERHTDAIHIGALGCCRAEHVTLFVSGTNVVNISATVQDVTLIDIFRHALLAGGATVRDARAGVVMTKTFVAAYQGASTSEGYQATVSAGSIATEAGGVVGATSPSHTVKSTAIAGVNARALYRLRDGNQDGWDILYAADGGASALPLQFRPVTAGVVASAVMALTKQGGLRNFPTANGPAGTFIMDAAVFKTIGNTNSLAASLIFLQATNAAAAALMAGAKSLYVTASAGFFTVFTADGTAAAGTETFNYWLVN